VLHTSSTEGTLDHDPEARHRVEAHDCDRFCRFCHGWTIPGYELSSHARTWGRVAAEQPPSDAQFDVVSPSRESLVKLLDPPSE
jgi:hypothetical protein